MAEERTPTEPRPELEPERGEQSVEPTLDRRSRRRADEREPKEAEPSVSRVRGDMPEALKRRYFTEDGRAVTSFFAGPGAKVAAFRDDGGKLSTHQVDPVVIRDMVAIAAHRGWRTVQVRGDDDFRREVWMEARAVGLEVRGYRPKQRDQQELEARIGGETTRTISPAPERARTGRSDPVSSARRKADYDAGVSGVLVEAGQAPYRRREGQPVTPFVRVDRGADGLLDIWGVGLTEALARSGARIGDQVLVRRDGVDRVQKPLQVRDALTGEIRRQAREVPRNRWTILAERFREASPAEAARDPELRAAQGQLAVAGTVIRATVQDAESRARLYAAAQDRAASHLAAGRQFRAVQVQQTVQVATRDVPEVQRSAARTDPEPGAGQERTRRK